MAFRVSMAAQVYMLARAKCGFLLLASSAVGHSQIHLQAEGNWVRTRCGSPASPGTDIPSEYGLRISPDTVKTAFGYPRPTMVRTRWHSLNGLWEFMPTSEGAVPPFGQTLSQTILVPFPVESCLSGLQNTTNAGVPPTYQHMVYRTVVDGRLLQADDAYGDVLLHFGAVDWQADVYVNSIWVGSHEGGYDGFSMNIASAIGTTGRDEILVQVYDPSNYGSQPFGKQRSSAMYSPAGDTYSPVSGIWQPVWLETVPSRHITALKIFADMQKLNINVITSVPDAGPVVVNVTMNGQVVAKGVGVANMLFSVTIPEPRLWSPEDPFLYNMTVTYGDDIVESYFGMREVSLCKDPQGVRRPCINSKYRFLLGVLDQSYWPDGQYTAPGDDALFSDLQALRSFGLNFIRLHQKVNPERWYYAADKLGIVIAQDVVQHYGDGTQGAGKAYESRNGHSRARFYWSDLKALIDGRANHPSIIQYETFNEQDMVNDFKASSAVEWVRQYDCTRLIDTDSGGPANAEQLGDVNDLHAGSPNPMHPSPSKTQYAMDGEYGNMEYFRDGHTWTNSSNLKEVCRLYGANAGPDGAHEVARTYINMTGKLREYGDVSVAGYVQLTDTEMECDGLLSYDRTAKFNSSDTLAMKQANLMLIGHPIPCIALPRDMRKSRAVSNIPQWLLNGIKVESFEQLRGLENPLIV